MGQFRSSRRGLWICLVLAAATFLLTLVAWLVNLELAIKYVSANEHLVLYRALPHPVYEVVTTLAVDMSTVSTLLPMLLCAFVLGGLWWKLSHTDNSSPRWADADYVPFPAHFPSFCFWSGLAATLYGLIIGLPDQQASGDPIAVQRALATLIVGFKTAVISTLVGMACAGIAIAVSSSFRRYLFPSVDPPTLAATIEAVRMGFGELTSGVTTVLSSLSQLHHRALQTAGQLESCARRIQEMNNTVGGEWFMKVLQELAAQSAAGTEQLKCVHQILGLLLKSNGDAMSQSERDKFTDDRHKELIEVLSNASATELEERFRFSRGLEEGLHELAGRLRPSTNGSPEAGVSR